MNFWKVFQAWRSKENGGKAGREQQEFPSGIKIWADPEDAVVDIIFVHGLGGHREQTWQHRDATEPWPKALLANSITDARIITYGYDARVGDWKDFLGKVSKSGIKQNAQTLLETFASRRVKAQRRSIVFVCHSLGGIVCKDALVCSQSRATEPHLKEISESTRGIVFLGTPHRGAQLAVWATSLAGFVGLIKQTNKANLRQIEKDSEDLDRIQDDFDNLLRCRTQNELPEIHIKCFYEQLPMTGLGQIVDEKSAVLAGNTPIGINKNHREMTKFTSKEDHGYGLIEFTLQRWLGTKAVKQEVPILPGQPSPSESSGSSSSKSSTSSRFIKIPPSGSFIVNEKIIKLPRYYFPDNMTGKSSRYYEWPTKAIATMESILCPNTATTDAGRVVTGSHRSVLITGLEGAGKSELAFRFAKKFDGQFDAIFFLIADSTDRLLEQCSDIAYSLGLVEESESGNPERCSAIFQTWLGDPIRGAPENLETRDLVRWLLVFDNAEDADVIDRFWPAGDGGSIIITSRNPLLNPWQRPITETMKFDGLQLEEGASFLRMCVGENHSSNSAIADGARTISIWTQGLPIAIQQLGRFMLNNSLSIVQFLKRYPKKSDLFDSVYASPENGNNLVTSWALDRLEQDNMDSFSLLAIVALLDPERIDESFLLPLPTSVNGHGTTMTNSEFLNNRRHLATTSMIDVNPGSQEVSVHRVVQDVMISILLRHGKFEVVFNEVIQRVAHRWPFLNRNYVTGNATKVDRWVACRLAYPHIVRLMEIYDGLPELQANDTAVFDLAELLLEAVQYRVERGAGHETIRLLRVAEKIYDFDRAEDYSLDMERAKLYRGRIGLAVSSKNPDDLLQYAQLAFEVEERRHKEIGHPTSILAVAFNDLAHAWACHREWDQAVRLLKVSREIREQLPDFTRDKLFSPLYHLGLVLQHQGKYNEAEEVLNEAIKDRENAFGPADAVSVRSGALFYARGNVKFSRADPTRRDIESSLTDHKEALSRVRRSAGEKSPTTLICEYQVAKVYAKLGQYNQACSLLDKILSSSIDNPVYDRDIARYAFLYAQCLRMVGGGLESNRWVRKSLEIHNRLLPNNRRTTGTLSEEDVTNLVPYDWL